MNRRATLPLGLLVALAAVSVALAPAAFASTHYAVDVAPAVDTPTRDLDFQSSTYTVSSIGRVDPGGSFTASVTAPAGEEYKVLLYNASGLIYDFERGGGTDDTVTFSTSSGGTDYPTGSYMVVVSHDGVYEAIQPLVVSAYHVDVSAPDAAATDETVEVSASLRPVAGGGPVDEVTLVVGNDATDHRIPMGETTDGEYAASVDVSRFSPEDYSLYVVVRGPNEVFGRRELIATSDSQPFEVTAPPGTTETTGAGVGGGGGGGAPAATTSRTTPTETTPGTTTSTAATSATPTRTSPRTHESTTGATPSGTTGAFDGSTATDRSVITPSAPAGSTSTTTVSQEWADVPLLGLAVAILLFWVRRTA